MSRLIWGVLLLALTMSLTDTPAIGEGADSAEKRPRSPSRDGLIIDSALVAVIDEAEVPARVEGVLAELTAREGSLVAAGDVLAKIEDTEPALTFKRAGVEVEIGSQAGAIGSNSSATGPPLPGAVPP